MNKTLKHVFLLALMVLCVMPAMAQLNGTGFYRVRNAQYNEYIKIANDKLHYHKIVDAAPGGTALANNTDNAQARALEFARRILKSDIKMMSTDYIDPTSIIYIKKLVNSSSDYTYDLQGQGTGLLTLTTGIYDGSSDITFKDIAATIKPVSGSNTYTASIELKGSITILFWTEEATLGVRYFMDDNGTFDIDEASSNLYDRWYVEPVNYFNVLPEVEFNGKYYTTIKVPFAFKLSNNVEKAYAITANNNGVLDYTEVATSGGTVPAGTPVVLECTSPNAADCRLIPTGSPLCPAQTPSTETAPPADQSSSYTGTNLLDGTYFANTDGTLSYSGTYSGGSYNASYNVDNFTSTSGKCVLGITSSGKLGFVPATGTMMPVNKAWLTSNAEAEFPWELPKVDADLSYETAEYTVYVGQSFTAPTLTNPHELTGITYSSDNTSAATVDQNTGAVTIGNTAGDAVITATFAGNDQYTEGSANYTIHVLAKTTPELSFNPTAVTVEAGAEEFTAPVLNNPAGVTVTYSSNNEDVALVDETTGEVLIGDAGTAVITATFAGSTAYNTTSASYTITVNKKAAGLAYGTAEYTVYTGQDFETPTLTNPNNLTVAYSSSDEDLALVDEATGEVAIGDDVGDVVITATFAGNGEYETGSASYTIHILAKTTPELTFNPTEVTAVFGAEEFTAPALNNPAGVTVTYSSNNEDVALVDETSGEVLIGDAGTAVITATFAGNTQYNASSASYTITVTKAPHGLQFVLPAGSTVYHFISVTDEDPVEPELKNPNNLPVTYSSNDESVVTVDPTTGALTPHSPGTCSIFAETPGDANHDGGKISYPIYVRTEEATYTLVTDASKLNADDKIIIVGQSSVGSFGMTVGSYGSAHVFGSQPVTIQGNQITTNAPDIFILEKNAETNNWKFKTVVNNYYIGANGNNEGFFYQKNLISWQVQQAEAAISIDATSGNATIKFNAEPNNIIMMTTFSNARFECRPAGYTSYVVPVRIYKQFIQVDPELSFAADMPTTAYAGTELNLVVNKPEGVDVTFTSSNPEVATVDENGTVTFLQSGEVTITATSVETDEYSVGTATLTITVIKTTTTLSFEEAEYTAYIGEDFTAPTLSNPDGVTVTYSSSNENLAMVDEATGEVLIGETPGDVVITATFAGNGQYEPASATYTLHIKSKYLRGDVDANGVVDINDATALINFLLSDDPTGINMENANCDLEDEVDIADATLLINYLLYDTW